VIGKIIGRGGEMIKVSSICFCLNWIEGYCLSWN
jgi:hypothetical protein